MPLYLTPQQAKRWEELKNGTFAAKKMKKKRDPANLERDNKIAWMIRDNVPMAEIRRKLGVGPSRLNRILKEMDEEAKNREAI